MKYIQRISVDHNVQDLMKLDCVRACNKIGDGTLIYIVMDGNDPCGLAFEGDALVQTEDGHWHIERKDETINEL
jgi:hypothetical protein